MVGPSQGIALVKETDVLQILTETKFSKFLNFLNKQYRLWTHYSIAVAILEVFLATIGNFSGLPTIVSVTGVSIMGGKLIL